MTTRSRPATLWLLVSVLGLLSLGGASGAAMFFYAPDGRRIGMAETLRSLPVDSFLLPGLFLLLAMCLAPALIAYGLVARPSWAWAQRALGWRGLHWSWGAALLLGLGLVLWLAVQAHYIGFGAPAQYFTAVLAVGVLVFTLAPPTRRALQGHDRPQAPPTERD